MVSYSVLQAGSFIRKRSSVLSMVMCLKVFFGCLLCLFSENGSNEPVILMQLRYAFHVSIKITVLSLVSPGHKGAYLLELLCFCFQGMPIIMADWESLTAIS